MRPKTSPRILADINAYGASVAPLAGPVTDPPDLVEELRQRGVEVDEGDAALLRDETWPPEVRAALVALVQTAEEYGVRYEITFDHDEQLETVSLGTLRIKLAGP